MNAILELDKIENTLSNRIEDKWLNISEASRYASLSITRIRKAVISGSLESQRTVDGCYSNLSGLTNGSTIRRILNLHLASSTT